MKSESKSICFILPYFGAFPPWFSAFLLSCEHNPGIHWRIFTDITPLPDQYPDNVSFEHCTLSEIQEKLSSLLGHTIRFDKPHKLCDVKPMYGLLFEEQLQGYAYWGHCDLDLIWGDIEGFVDQVNYRNYDIVSSRKETISGHFTLYKNNEQLRHYFKKVPNYLKVFDNPDYAGFDEGYFAYHAYTHHEADGLKIYWPEKFGVDWGELHSRPAGWQWQDGKILDIQGTERPYLHFMKWKKSLSKSLPYDQLRQAGRFSINKYGLWTNGPDINTKLKLIIDDLKRAFSKKEKPPTNPPRDPATIPWEYRIME